MATRKRSTSGKTTTAKPRAGTRKSPRYSEKARRGIAQHIRKHKREGMPQKQAVAAAMSEQRRKGRKVPPRPRAAKR